MPYIYTLAWSTYESGTSFLKPMWWLNASMGNLTQQYLFGDVLVSPVNNWAAVNQTVATVLPAGRWVSWDGWRHWTGDSVVSIDATLHTTPLFVKAGVALPMWPPGVCRARSRTRWLCLSARGIIWKLDVRPFSFVPRVTATVSTRARSADRLGHFPCWSRCRDWHAVSRRW